MCLLQNYLFYNSKQRLKDVVKESLTNLRFLHYVSPPRFQWDGDFGRPPKVDPPPAENDTEVLCNIHLCGNDIRTIEKSVVIPAKTGIHFIYGQYS